MKTKLLVTVSALILSGSLAFAQEVAPEPTLVEDRISELRLDGFKRFEVKVGLTQTKIEAINPANQAKMEIVIDSATGDVLSEEAGTVDFWENTTEGVFYRTRNRDFVDADDNGSDTSEDSMDDNSDEDNSDDDNGADTSGNSSDDDSSGGSSSSGNDDN